MGPALSWKLFTRPSLLGWMKGNPPMKKQSWKRTDKGCIALKKKKNQTHLNMANLSYFSFENMCHRKEYLHRTPLKKIVFRFIYICICLRYKKKHIVCSQRQNFRQQLHVASDFWKFANISFIATETEKLPKKMINQFVQ